MELERTWGGVGSAGPPVVMSEEDLGESKEEVTQKWEWDS